MIVEVEGGVVHPHRPALPEWHLHDPMSKSRDAVEPPTDVAPQSFEVDAAVIVAERVSFQDGERADMLRLVICLDPEK